MRNISYASGDDSQGKLIYEFDESALRESLTSKFKAIFESSGLPDSKERDDLVEQCLLYAHFPAMGILEYLELARSDLIEWLVASILDVVLKLDERFPDPAYRRQYLEAHANLWKELVIGQSGRGHPKGASDPRADDCLLRDVRSKFSELRKTNPGKRITRIAVAKALRKDKEMPYQQIKYDEIERRIKKLLERTPPLTTWEKLSDYFDRRLKKSFKTP